MSSPFVSVYLTSLDVRLISTIDILASCVRIHVLIDK